MSSSAHVYLDNDFLVEEDVTRPATATGASEAAAGLTGLTGRMSLTDGGAAIHASLSVALSERSGTPGRYYGVIQGSDLRTHLATAAGEVRYLVVGDGTNVLTSRPVKILATRRPD